jgi:hypothetical protein
MKTHRCLLPMVFMFCSMAMVINTTFADDKAAASAVKSVEIVSVKDAGDLEKFAAAELQRYVERLFGVSAKIVAKPSGMAEAVFVLGTSTRCRSDFIESKTFPPLSDQGFLLRKTNFNDKPALLILGGSPRATMWGVYEFVERCGVRYLLTGDVLPEKQLAFSLPEIDRTFEPAFKMRWFKTMGDFAMGMEGWGMADYRPFLDQLAKLKFNRIRVGGCPTGPFLHLHIKGVEQKSAYLWYNEHFPITPDMPGRKLFGDEKEFWNPDLPPPGASYKETAAAGRRHMHALIAYARSRGIDASSIWSLVDFPKELSTAIPDPQTVNQLGYLTVSPGSKVRPDSPEMLEIGRELLLTILNEYPDADPVGFPPGTEFPAWVDMYEHAWRELDKQYGIESILPLEKVLLAAKKRTDHWDGGSKRSLIEVKGHITGLYYLLRLWNDPEVFPKSKHPNARLVVYEVAEELWPILPRVLPKGAELNVVMDYNCTRVLRRKNVISTLPKQVPTTMVLSLHDDSVGMVPQLAVNALHQLVSEMRKAGVAGFGTRQWLIGDHDVGVNYLSKAAWDAATTPEAVYADQVRAVCGAAAVEPMLKAFHEIETVTSRLEDHGMGITFPHHDMFMTYWSPDALQPPFLEDQAIYRRALEIIRKMPQPEQPEGRAYVNYWIGRLDFAVGYFDALRAIQKAAIAEQAAKDAEAKGDKAACRAKFAEALQHGCDARKIAFDAIDAYANVAKSRADAGAVATMAELVCRRLDQKNDELRQQRDKTR